MKFFRSVREPSVVAWLRLFLLWLVLSVMVLFCLIVWDWQRSTRPMGWHVEAFMALGGAPWCYSLALALVLSSVHYCYLRKNLRLKELGMLVLAGLAAVGVVSVAVVNVHRHNVLFERFKDAEDAGEGEKFTAMYRGRDYAGLVEAMEIRMREYDAAVSDLGGWRHVELSGAFVLRKAPAIGMSALLVHMHPYNDLHSRYMPSDVEWFLYDTVDDSGYYDQNPRDLHTPWQEVAKLMVVSEHPVLKALGLWFRGDFGAYREFVYQKVDEGDERFIGMAAHAADRYDEDAQRAQGYTDRYNALVEQRKPVGGM